MSLDVVSGAVTKAPGNPAGDVVVMTWYDQANNCLWYSYNTDPCSTGSGQWQANALRIDSGAGQYNRIKVDAAGHVHIAYYSNSGGDLKYAYLSSYNAGSATTIVVDSYEIVGTDINLDVAYNGTNYIPYVSYYIPSATKTKVAYPVTFSGGVAQAGVDSNDLYTGNWEISVVPTKHTPKDDTTMVGVNKTIGGVLQNSVGVGDTALGSFPYRTAATIGAASDNNQPTLVGGNGTMNPVTAFTVQDDKPADRYLPESFPAKRWRSSGA